MQRSYSSWVKGIANQRFLQLSGVSLAVFAVATLVSTRPVSPGTVVLSAVTGLCASGCFVFIIVQRARQEARVSNPPLDDRTQEYLFHWPERAVIGGILMAASGTLGLLRSYLSHSGPDALGWALFGMVMLIPGVCLLWFGLSRWRKGKSG